VPGSKLAAAAVGAVLAALAVVALASRGSPGDRTNAAYEAAPAGRTLLFVALGLALLATTALAVWALWPDGSATPRPEPAHRWLPYVLVAAILLAMGWAASHRDPDDEGSDPPAERTTAPVDEDPTGPDLIGRASPTGSLAATAALLAGLVAFTVLVRSARRRAGDEDGPNDDAAGTDSEDDGARPADLLSDALLERLAAGDLDAAIAEVEAEPDPRRAALLAYAVLDAHLAATPAARPPAATPHEWLRRIRRVHASDHPQLVEAAAAITVRYERARFSVAPFTDQDRTDAAADLRCLAPTRHDRTATG
jgi:hypothetical protein